MGRYGCHGSYVVAWMILASATAAVRGQEIVGSWTVEYRTQAVKVEAVEESLPEGNARLVTVKLMNISGRPITAIALDVEDGRGRLDMAWTAIPLKPGDTTDFKVRNGLRAEPHRRVRLKAALFADAGPDDGDPSAAHVLRIARLGGLLEENRCLGVLNRLDPSKLDDATVTELLASVDESPRTLDEALASLPQDPQVNIASHEQVRAASAEAREAFLAEVRFRRQWCNTEVRKLTQLSVSPEAERALMIELSRRQHQRRTDAVRPFCERDMEVKQ